MDLRNLQTFIRAAELGSFTRAAEESQYVQSTVSTQIQQLEKELGYPLFDRIGKRVSLTVLGEEFLSYAYRITRAMHDAANLDQNAADIRGTLRIGLLESLLFGNMLPLLPWFRSAYRNVELRLNMGQTSELLQQLRQNRLDLVYLSADLNTDPELRCLYRRREQLIFVASPRHPLAARQSIPVTELLTHDFVVTEHTGICYGRLRALAARHDAALYASVEVDSTVAIAELVEQNMALAFLPEYSVRKQLEQKRLVQLDIALEPQYYYSQILCHKNRWLPPFLEKLIEKLEQTYPGEEAE